MMHEYCQPLFAYYCIKLCIASVFLDYVNVSLDYCDDDESIAFVSLASLSHIEFIRVF